MLGMMTSEETHGWGTCCSALFVVSPLEYDIKSPTPVFFLLHSTKERLSSYKWQDVVLWTGCPHGVSGLQTLFLFSAVNPQHPDSLVSTSGEV